MNCEASRIARITSFNPPRLRDAKPGLTLSAFRVVLPDVLGRFAVKLMSFTATLFRAPTE
jgi:hypothetical protein